MRLVSVALVAAVVGGAIGAALVYAIDGRGGSKVVAQPTPQPDRVVGLVEKCSVLAQGPQPRSFEGDACGTARAAVARSSGAAVMATDNLELTIRTEKGTTYTVNVPASTSVAVGDPWPK